MKLRPKERKESLISSKSKSSPRKVLFVSLGYIICSLKKFISFSENDLPLKRQYYLN